MAFQMSFTDQYGDTFPVSYWKPVSTNRCKANKTACIMFYGYESEAKKDKRIIGQKQYDVSGSDFDTYFSAEALNPEGVDMDSQSYLMSIQTLDTLKNEQTVSFFDGAVNV